MNIRLTALLLLLFWAASRADGQILDAKPDDAKTEDVAPVEVITVEGKTERSTNEVIERNSKGSVLYGGMNLRDIPFTVHITTSQDIKNRQADTLSEALAGDPAVRNEFGGSGGFKDESFNIRGFAMDGSIAFFRDGVPMGSDAIQGMETIEQIEVVRGPMGFRQGFVPPGGAINVVSKRPTPNELRSLSVTTDQYGSVKVHADAGGRVGQGKDFGYRINAGGEDTKLFFKPVERKRKFLGLSFDQRLNASHTVRLTYDFNQVRSGPDLFHQFVPDRNGDKLPNIEPRTYTGQKVIPDNNFEVHNASLELESKLTQNLSLKVQGAYNTSRSLYLTTYANGVEPNGDFIVQGYASDIKNQAYSGTAFLSYQNVWAQMEHNLVLGLTAFQSRYSSKADFAGPITDDTNPLINNFYHPKQFDFQFPTPSGPYSLLYDERHEGYFLSDSLRIREKYIVLLAGRYAALKTAGLSSVTNYAFNPTVGLSYEASSDTTVYASYAAGVQAGGMAPLTAANSLERMGPVHSRQIEIGSKVLWRQGALAFDSSIFQIEKEAEYVNAQNVFTQSGRQTHNGLELRVQGKPLALWTVSSGVQYLDVKLSGDPATKGQKPYNVPKVNASLFNEYAFGESGFHASAALYHTGEREVSLPNKNAKADAYSRLDLGARYEAHGAGRQELITRISLENVTDEDYYLAAWRNYLEAGTPRMVSVSLEYRF